MVFAIPKEQRDDLVTRMDDTLAALGFHCYGQTFGGTRAKAEEIEERAFSVAEAQAATEAFVTSASSFVKPVVEIDGAQIGDGKPGPIATRLRELYIAEMRASAI